MTLYLDSSAFLKLYVAEAETAECRRLLASDSRWMTANHTLIEVRRNLARLLKGEGLRRARRFFGTDWGRTEVILLDEGVCERAARIAEETLIRAPDGMHLAAALQGGRPAFVTYDRRQAEAARSLGLTVAGV